MRSGSVRRLPRLVRWLWFAIVAVAAADFVFVGLGVVLGDAWLRTALQLSSILAGPLALGLLLAVGVSVWSGRGAAAPGAGRPDAGRSDAGRPAARLPPEAQVPLEVAVGRRAGQAAAALARSREGKLAISQTARFVRAVRAAAQPGPGSTGTDEPEAPSGSEQSDR